MARIIKSESRKMGGLESKLELFGILALILALLSAVATTVALGSAGLLPALATVFSAAVTWLLLSTLVEIVRLLKLQNGIPYAGKISSPQIVYSWTCSDCGSACHYEAKCEYCGATFDDHDPSR